MDQIVMNNLVMLSIGLIGLVSGIIIITRPNWFRNLWKIRTSYEYWGDRLAAIYFTILGLIIIVASTWLILIHFFPLFF